MKTRTITAVVGCLAATALSGCSFNPADYETPPVEVQTSQGVVICQLYRKDTTLWDEAISVPDGMSIAQGDEVCVNEGKRRIQES